ncbi:MAG: transcriptional regulator [Pirellulales bacterium]|nr:transcriptional regulator [Pirellulales bacterium]
MISLLQGGRGHNVNSLAEQTGVSRRTIFRDLDTFRNAGLAIVFDEKLQRYYLPGTQILPPTNLTSEEALSLIVLSHEMGGSDRVPFYGAARRAALKLESSLPSTLRDELREVLGSIEMTLPSVSQDADDESTFSDLQTAIGSRRSVRIRYRSFTPDEGTVNTRLQPYRLLFSRHSWFVIGRSSLHRATRTFNVHRITRLDILDDNYEVPRGFSLGRYLRNAWHLIPEPGPDRLVDVRFSPLVANNVAEVTWHKTQACRKEADGSLRFEATVSGIREISWWILGYGQHAEVINPPELRELVAEHARQMVKKYEA